MWRNDILHRAAEITSTARHRQRPGSDTSLVGPAHRPARLLAPQHRAVRINLGKALRVLTSGYADLSSAIRIESGDRRDPGDTTRATPEHVLEGRRRKPTILDRRALQDILIGGPVVDQLTGALDTTLLSFNDPARSLSPDQLGDAQPEFDSDTWPCTTCPDTASTMRSTPIRPNLRSGRASSPSPPPLRRRPLIATKIFRVWEPGGMNAE